MINYADYVFYQRDYLGNLSIDLFNSLIVKASREIDKNINCELNEETINKLSDKEQWKLKYVACELCDYFQNETSASSISIDGVSISQSNPQKDKPIILNGLPIKLTRYI